MSLKQLRNFFLSLRFRVTFWFVGTFTLLFFILLITFYFIVRSDLHKATDAPIVFELEELANVYRNHGIKGCAAQIDEESEEYGANRIFYRILDGNYKELLHSDLSTWGKIPINWAVLNNLQDRKYISETVLLPQKNREIRIVSMKLDDGNLIAQSGIYLNAELEQVAYYRKMLPIIGISITLLAAVIGFFVVHRLVKRIDDVTALAGSISSSNLTQRLPLQYGADEINALATEINQMLDRIENLVAEIKQISDGLAHDLRSSIARIRAGAEIILGNEHLDLTLQEGVADTIEECDRVLVMVNSMLDISQVDAGTINFEMDLLNLSTLVADAVELFEAVAADKHLEITLAKEDNLTVKGEVGMLQRIVSNLIDNAIKFTPKGGSITIKLFADGGFVTFICEDSGIGIAEQDLPNVFNRFYRCDSSRSSSGNGLGLTICRSFIKAHGGSIKISSKKDHGTTVTFKLPKER